MNQEVFEKWQPTYKYGNLRTREHKPTIYETKNLRFVDLPWSEIEFKTPGIENVLSNVQLEAVTCALTTFYNKENMKSKTRGFLLGDGTGVGKTRTLAGIISEMEERVTRLRGIWLCPNNNLIDFIKEENSLVNSTTKFISDVSEGDGILISTYSKLVRQKSLGELVNWLNNSDDTVLIFDESHIAKNASSLTGKMVQEIQLKMPKACAVYCSATAATSLAELAYAPKLGLKNIRTKGKNKKLPNSAMEMVALRLKKSGRLVSRHLGYENIECTFHKYILDKHERDLYDTLCTRLQSDESTLQKVMFMDHVLVYFKTKKAIQLIEKSLKRGETVVVSIQNTGESAYTRSQSSIIKDYLNSKGVYDIDEEFPNPIDSIVAYFGSEQVSELSGRKYRSSLNGVRESVPKFKDELASFQNGRKRIAIITKSGCCGISLHANEISNQSRHHIILQNPQSAESFMQHVGRTHRTGTVKSVPKYSLILTDVPSDYKFTCSLSNKLEKLGALTKGDKNTSSFDVCAYINTNTVSRLFLEMNVRSAYAWYIQKSQDININQLHTLNILGGLRQYRKIYENERHAVPFFLKLLRYINYYIEKGILSDEDHNFTLNQQNSLYFWSSRQWMYMWVNNMDRYIRHHHINYGRVSEHFIYIIVHCILNVLSDCIPVSKHWFENTVQYFEPEAIHVATPFLCQRILPELVYNEIFSYLRYENKMTAGVLSEVNVPRMTFNYLESSTPMTGFFNDIISRPLSVQDAIFNSLGMYRNTANDTERSIVQFEKFLTQKLLGYEVKYSGYGEYGDEYHLTVNLVNRMPIPDYIDFIRKKLEGSHQFVQSTKHALKKGVIVFLTESKWFCELWYPGMNHASQKFTKYQWLEEKDDYKTVDYNISSYLDEGLCVIQRKNEIASKRNGTYVFVIEKALERWNCSSQQIIRVPQTSVNPKFLGLYICKK